MSIVNEAHNLFSSVSILKKKKAQKETGKNKMENEDGTKKKKMSKETAINKLADSLESSQMAAGRVALVEGGGFGINTVRCVSGCTRSLSAPLLTF